MVEVFVNEGQPFDRLFVVSDRAVYVANPKAALLPEIETRLRAGAPPMEVAPEASEVPYAAIIGVKANKWRVDLSINFRNGKRSAWKNVCFKDASSRDSAFAALERRLSPQMRKAEVQYSVGRAAIAPLVVAVLVAILGYGLFLAAQDQAAGAGAQIEGRRQGAKKLLALALEMLGPTGVGIIAAVLLCVCIAWLVKRVRKPPLMVTLKAPA